MKRSRLISQGSLDRLLKTAYAALERKDFQTGIEALESANRLAPSNARILLQLGNVYGMRYDYPAAERCFEQALRFAPSKRVMLVAVANHCHYFRNTELLERYLRRSLDEPDATSLDCLKLAELCERLHRLPEATQLVERALNLDPADPAALVISARLERTTGRLEQAEQRLRSTVSKPIPDTWTHALAWYELGNILDRQEKYDDAMSAYLQAKSLLRAQADKDFGRLKIQSSGLKMIESSISAGMLQRWFENGPAFAPQRRLALLCGYPRSGTTLLEQVLDAHPGMVSSEETEIFADDALPPLKRDFKPDAPLLRILEDAGMPALNQARKKYFRSMELSLGQPVGERLLIDKNPILTAQIPAFFRIFPETKFLVGLRDPRDVVLSRFLIPQPIVPLTTPFLTLEGTVDDYVATMSLWRALAPILPAPSLEVRYEDLVDDVEAVARKVLNFMGVEWDARVLAFDKHTRTKMVRSPTYADVAQPIYKRAKGRWRNYQKYFEPYQTILAPFVKAFGYE